MDKATAEGLTKTGFLIDGYPREVEQGHQFEKEVQMNIHLKVKKKKIILFNEKIIYISRFVQRI